MLAVVTLRLFFAFINFNHKSHEQPQAHLHHYAALDTVASPWGLVGLAPKQSSKTPNWNMKHYRSVEVLSIFIMSTPLPYVKSLYWRLSGDGSVWTVNWNIYRSIQSYIMQPVSLLGFNTVHSWKSSLWSDCGKCDGQRNAAILVVSSTVLAQHKLCLTSETMRLLKWSEMS